MPKKLLRYGVLFCLAIATVVGAAVFSGDWAFIRPAIAEAGDYVAALEGFSVDEHGFSFENYGEGNSLTNLTPEDLERMFGERVCAAQVAGTCELTPPAAAWMEKVNTAMNGGHCEGMAALSLLFYTGKLKPDQFGNGDYAAALQLKNNQELQREIAYWFATQFTTPTSRSETRITPNQVLDTLVRAFENQTETYTFGIYKPTTPADGHAMTPWAVEDRGNGLFAVKIYDNNYPGVDREVLINRKENTWSYNASTNPNEPESLYEGDAETKTLTLAPTSVRLKPQVCPFCDDEDDNSTPDFNEIWLTGPGDLLLTNAQGRRYGTLNGKLVQEIPEVYSIDSKSKDLWNDDQEAVYYVPQGMEVTLTIDGSRLQKVANTSVAIIGPGYELGVDEIQLDPDQEDSLTLLASGTDFSYTTLAAESPTLSLGFEGDGADYAFEFKGVDLDGAVINLGLEESEGRVSLNTKGNETTGTYAFSMSRIDPTGEQTFYNDGVELDPDDTVYFDYGKWTGDGSSLELEVDRGSTGSINETIQLVDEAQ